MSGSAGSCAQWVRCPGCGSLLYGKKLQRNLQVCPECGDHRRLDAWARIDQLVDSGSFVAQDEEVCSVDVLGFTDSLPYPARLARAREISGMAEAVQCGVATVGGNRIALAVMDFRFMGGSLGSAVGELITRTVEAALRDHLPLVVVTASGGARMQEGCLSLMQMAKTSQAIGRMREAGLLTVSVVTDPTYGGVAASFATNCDVVVAERGARMGFAGPRVIEQTIRRPLPEGFQKAEFLLAHGQVDVVTHRRDLRHWLERLLRATAVTPVLAVGPDVAVARLTVRDHTLLDRRDPAETVTDARNRDRPTTLDYVGRIFDSFVELHGDRSHGDCPAIIAGLARFDGRPVAVIGHQKGHVTVDLVARNFGMPRPEGYRKALRMMRLAERHGIPVLTFVDTPGADPGIDAENRGQSAAISESILVMSSLATPVVTVVTGEGGSGGALALAVADRVLALERAYYSVISPEGCSTILWGDATAAAEAARALHFTAPELLALGIVDGVVPEPPGGAHLDHSGIAENLRRALRECLAELYPVSPDDLVEERRTRFRNFGVWRVERPDDIQVRAG